MKIYSFIKDSKRSAIEIKSTVKYDDLELVYGPSTIKDNNKFTIYKGNKPFDCLPYFDSVNWVFSEKVKNLFEKNDVTGIEFYPIEIEGLDVKYFGYYVTGRAGNVLNTDDMDCIPMFEPLEFNISEWDGSDVFMFTNSTGSFITEKVKDIFKKNNITNLSIEESN